MLNKYCNKFIAISRFTPEVYIVVFSYKNACKAEQIHLEQQSISFKIILRLKSVAIANNCESDKKNTQNNEN